jgi:hypothetical protein
MFQGSSSSMPLMDDRRYMYSRYKKALICKEWYQIIAFCKIAGIIYLGSSPTDL